MPTTITFKDGTIIRGLRMRFHELLWGAPPATFLRLYFPDETRYIPLDRVQCVTESTPWEDAVSDRTAGS